MALMKKGATTNRKERVIVNRGIGKKGILRNEKGLTLVELLAVIVIIGILAAIAVPSVSGLITKSKQQAHRANAQMIVDAARMKIVTEDFVGGTLGTGSGGTSTSTIDIYLTQLVNEGYLEKMPDDPENKGGKYESSYTPAASGGSPSGSGSKVTAIKDNTSGSISYRITLVGKRGGAATPTTYLNDVAEESISSVPIQ